MSTIGDVTTIPAGWYPDPADESRSRWWDGTGWTSSISEPQPPAPTAQPFVEPQQYVQQPFIPATPAKPAVQALTRREIREQSQLALAASGAQQAAEPEVIGRSAHTAHAPEVQAADEQAAPSTPVRKLPTIEEVIAMAAANPAPAPSVPFDWSPNAVVPARTSETGDAAAPAAPAAPVAATEPAPAPHVPAAAPIVAPAASPATPLAVVEQLAAAQSNPLPGMPSYLNAGPPVVPAAPIAPAVVPAAVTVEPAVVAAPAPTPAATPAPAAAAPAVIATPTGPAFPRQAAVAPAAAAQPTPPAAPVAEAPAAAPAPAPVRQQPALKQLAGTNPFEPTAAGMFDGPITAALTPMSVAAFASTPLAQVAAPAPVATVDPKKRSASTFGIWGLALAPLLTTALAWVAIVQLGLDSSGSLRYVLIGAPLAIHTLLAGLDKRSLEKLGHERTVNPLFAVIPPLYLLIRLVRVGSKTVGPLLLWVVSVAASGAFVYLSLTSFLASFGI